MSLKYADLVRILISQNRNEGKKTGTKLIVPKSRKPIAVFDYMDKYVVDKKESLSLTDDNRKSNLTRLIKFILEKKTIRDKDTRFQQFYKDIDNKKTKYYELAEIIVREGTKNNNKDKDKCDNIDNKLDLVCWRDWEKLSTLPVTGTTPGPTGSTTPGPTGSPTATPVPPTAIKIISLENKEPAKLVKIDKLTNIAESNYDKVAKNINKLKNVGPFVQKSKFENTSEAIKLIILSLTASLKKVLEYSKKKFSNEIKIKLKNSKNKILKNIENFNQLFESLEKLKSSGIILA